MNSENRSFEKGFTETPSNEQNYDYFRSRQTGPQQAITYIPVIYFIPQVQQPPPPPSPSVPSMDYCTNPACKEHGHLNSEQQQNSHIPSIQWPQNGVTVQEVVDVTDNSPQTYHNPNPDQLLLPVHPTQNLDQSQTLFETKQGKWELDSQLSIPSAEQICESETCFEQVQYPTIELSQPILNTKVFKSSKKDNLSKSQVNSMSNSESPKPNQGVDKFTQDSVKIRKSSSNSKSNKSDRSCSDQSQTRRRRSNNRSNCSSWNPPSDPGSQLQYFVESKGICADYMSCNHFINYKQLEQFVYNPIRGMDSFFDYKTYKTFQEESFRKQYQKQSWWICPVYHVIGYRITLDLLHGIPKTLEYVRHLTMDKPNYCILEYDNEHRQDKSIYYRNGGEAYGSCIAKLEENIKQIVQEERQTLPKLYTLRRLRAHIQTERQHLENWNNWLKTHDFQDIEKYEKQISDLQVTNLNLNRALNSEKKEKDVHFAQCQRFKQEKVNWEAIYVQLAEEKKILKKEKSNLIEKFQKMASMQNSLMVAAQTDKNEIKSLKNLVAAQAAEIDANHEQISELISKCKEIEATNAELLHFKVNQLKLTENGRYFNGTFKSNFVVGGTNKSRDNEYQSDKLRMKNGNRSGH